MTSTGVLYGKRMLVLAILFASFISFDAQCQMTQREMDNFKKLDKERQKRKKQGGPSINTKKRLTSPKKTRQKKSLFSKKRYNLTYYYRENELSNPLA